MKSRLLLHCDTDRSLFILSKQGENWRHQFRDLRSALDYASSLVSEDTEVLVHNESGRVMMESVVSPTAPSEGEKHV